MKHTWVPVSIPWWVPFTTRVRFEMQCEECGAQRDVDVEVPDATVSGECLPGA